MTLSRDEARRAAALSRLRVADAELDGLAADLSRVLGYMEELKAVDVEGVAPMAHPADIDLPLRPDEVLPGVGHAGIAASAGYEEGFVRVPRVVE